VARFDHFTIDAACYPGLGMPLIPLLALEDVPAGTAREATAEGRTYAVCHTNEGLFVVDGDCPHGEGPLACGGLHKHTLVCPWHAWEFDVRTGECDGRPDCRIGTYSVIVRDGSVLIDVG
jgi:nitrite reductase (NADH) small subunit